MATASPDHGPDVLEVRQDMIETTTMLPQYRRDPDWVHVDDHGHEHRYGGVSLVLNFEEGWDADGEEWSRQWYECAQCGAVVEPGMVEIPGTGNGMRSYAPGVTHYLLNGEEISPERFAEMAQQRIIDGGTTSV